MRLEREKKDCEEEISRAERDRDDREKPIIAGGGASNGWWMADHGGWLKR